MPRLLLSLTVLAILAGSQSPPLFAQGPASFAETPKTKKADEALAQGADEATQSYSKGREREFAAWLRAYEKVLASARAAGDPDAVDYVTRVMAESKKAGFVVKLPPPDAAKHEGHSYALIPETVGWHVAKRRCELMGGHLVTIESAGEADFLATTFGKNPFWIGAGDFDSEGDYRRLDGTPFEAFDYVVRFDNDNGFQHAIHWNAKDQRWDDGDEGAPVAYVCEWER